MHVHCKNNSMECKFWIDMENYDIQDAFLFHMSPKDVRQIRKIIFEHLDYIASRWEEFQKGRQT